MEELQELVSLVEKAAIECNMIINSAKTKVATYTSKTLEVLVDASKLEQVDLFGYFGNRITDEACCIDEVKTRLAMSVAAIINLAKMWKKNKAISTNTKRRLMITLVWPVATYGFETWTLKKEEERHI